MRVLQLLVLSVCLCLPSVVFAQSESAPPDDQAPPSGPVLQAADATPAICDPAETRLRFLQVTGTGFDAWAMQRLVGDVVDANGAAQIHWGSVWVSPQGNLTLEVNLCSDPFQHRPALAPGDYTVSVGQANAAPIAATGITLSEPGAVDENAPEQAMPATASTNPTPTPFTFVSPAVQAQPTRTRLPFAALASPTPTPGPRTGSGSQQQPYPQGAPGNLVDGWQLVITGVTPDAYSGIHAAIASSTAPASDQRDFMIRVQATYLGPGTGVFSGVRLALVSGIQTTYDQIRNSCGVIPDSLSPNLVTSGTTVRGNVCFTVRASDIDSLVLLDNQSSDADKVFFALK